jgi:hypothetical protein
MVQATKVQAEQHAHAQRPGEQRMGMAEERHVANSSIAGGAGKSPLCSVMPHAWRNYPKCPLPPMDVVEVIPLGRCLDTLGFLTAILSR